VVHLHGRRLRVHGLPRACDARAGRDLTCRCSASRARPRSSRTRSGLWQQSIWYSRPWSTTAKHTLDGLIYGCLTGGTFGWLWHSGVSLEFNWAAKADHVRIEVSGDFSLEALLPMCDRFFEVTAGAGQEALLVDARSVTGREPTMAERYQWAVRVADAQARHQPRIRGCAAGARAADTPGAFRRDRGHQPRRPDPHVSRKRLRR
jgi:hypothetical protein